MDGILCVNKPEGFTSFDVIAKMRGIARCKKIGHGGTLDPMATGVLPLYFGAATRAVDMVPGQKKEYRATFLLGQTTDTLDRTGTLLETRPVRVGRAEVLALLPRFTGEQEQLPPMYSAVSVGGRRLYDLARQGIEVERKPRRITVEELELLDGEGDSYTLRILCSKGTYVRSLVSDLGEALGCGAVLTDLVRTRSGPYTLKDCITLEEAQAKREELASLLLPVETAFAHLPALSLTAHFARLFANGVRLRAEQVGSPQPGEYRVFGPDGFLGVALQDGGQLRIKRLFLGGR